VNNSCRHIAIIPTLSIQRVCLFWKGWMKFLQIHFIQRRRVTQMVGFHVTNRLFFESTIIWDVMLCSVIEVYQYFKEIYCFYLQG
jgi:hypothetical protein